MCIRGCFLLLFLLFISINYYGQDFEWQQDVEKLLQEYQACEPPINTPCNIFLARSLKRIYGINDFDRENAQDSYLTANEIADYVIVNTDKWTLLGIADKQNVLDEAQGYANSKKAVIAVMPGSPHGHVALVLPGLQSLSGSWGLKVPNSASFFLAKPKSSYIGKPLSFAFAAPQKGKVKIYARNF